MANATRPYVIPRITDTGTVRLLLPDQTELDLTPLDAAELGVQLLRTFTRTYTGVLHLGAGDHELDGITWKADQLEVDPRGYVRLRLPTSVPWQVYRERALRAVRVALGCT